MGGSVFLDHARRTLLLIPLALCALTSAADAQGRTRNVVLVTLDGVRTEEMFGGLDVDVLRSTIGEARESTETDAYRKYGAATAEERRALLMPFFWGQLMKTQGSIAGNQALGSRVLLANKRRLSYPGYSEWLAVASPDVPLRSEWRNGPVVYQNQIAASVARLIGFDLGEQNPQAGRPIDRLFELR